MSHDHNLFLLKDSTYLPAHKGSTGGLNSHFNLHLYFGIQFPPGSFSDVIGYQFYSLLLWSTNLFATNTSFSYHSRCVIFTHFLHISVP